MKMPFKISINPLKSLHFTLKMSFNFLSQNTFLYIVEDSLISISSIILNNIFDVITCQLHIFSGYHFVKILRKKWAKNELSIKIRD